MEPIFFATPEDFRAWLEAHHDTEAELLVGFHKRATGRPSMTWPESVDQALRFGWIDGVRKRLDDERYMIRFTPRKPSSRWSRVNVARVAELEQAGLMRPAGLTAFAARTEKGTYSYEQRDAAAFDPEREQRFRANEGPGAWSAEHPPWSGRTATHGVMSAKRDETRAPRPARLVEAPAAGRAVGPLGRPA